MSGGTFQLVSQRLIGWVQFQLLPTWEIINRIQHVQVKLINWDIGLARHRVVMVGSGFNFNIILGRFAFVEMWLIWLLIVCGFLIAAQQADAIHRHPEAPNRN